MTREEAINIIEKDIQIDVRSCTNEEVHKFITALNMAISALREQCVRDATKTSGETVTNRNGLTNADRIRSMTDEELAEFLCCVYDDENCGVYQDECGKFICGITILDYDQYKIADWLKQPYKEDT